MENPNPNPNPQPVRLIYANMPKFSEHQKQVCDAAYGKCLHIIDDTVRRFVQRYGGHFETLRADADTGFMRCYTREQEPTTAKLKQYVWFNLLDQVRREAIRAKKLRFREIESYEEPTVFDQLADWSDNLGPDARIAVMLVLDPPVSMSDETAAKGGTPRNVRSSLRSYLQRMGWTTRRVSAAFKEITDNF
jgi:hypothetical protein